MCTGINTKLLRLEILATSLKFRPKRMGIMLLEMCGGLGWNPSMTTTSKTRPIQVYNYCHHVIIAHTQS